VSLRKKGIRPNLGVIQFDPALRSFSFLPPNLDRATDGPPRSPPFPPLGPCPPLPARDRALFLWLCLLLPSRECHGCRKVPQVLTQLLGNDLDLTHAPPGFQTAGFVSSFGIRATDDTASNWCGCWCPRLSQVPPPPNWRTQAPPPRDPDGAFSAGRPFPHGASDIPACANPLFFLPYCPRTMRLLKYGGAPAVPRSFGIDWRFFFPKPCDNSEPAPAISAPKSTFLPPFKLWVRNHPEQPPPGRGALPFLIQLDGFCTQSKDFFRRWF